MGIEMTHCYGRRSEITKHYDTGKAGRLHFAFCSVGEQTAESAAKSLLLLLIDYWYLIQVQFGEFFLNYMY